MYYFQKNFGNVTKNARSSKLRCSKKVIKYLQNAHQARVLNILALILGTFPFVELCTKLTKFRWLNTTCHHSISEVPGDIKCHVTATESLDNWHYYYYYYHHYHYQHV